MTPPGNKEVSYLPEAGPAVHPSARELSSLGGECDRCQSEPGSLAGVVPFDWETIWVTLASFPKRCKGMFRSTRSQASPWPVKEQLFSLIGWALPLLEKVPGKEGAPQVFRKTNGLGPLGRNESQDCRGTLGAISDPGPGARNTSYCLVLPQDFSEPWICQ